MNAKAVMNRTLLLSFSSFSRVALPDLKHGHSSGISAPHCGSQQLRVSRICGEITGTSIAFVLTIAPTRFEHRLSFLCDTRAYITASLIEDISPSNREKVIRSPHTGADKQQGSSQSNNVAVIGSVDVVHQRWHAECEANWRLRGFQRYIHFPTMLV
jgi:hypothetical protein